MNPPGQESPASRCTPRAQIVDLTGAFGSLSLDAGTVLAQAPETVSSSVWAGPAQTYRRERVPTSAYVQRLLAEDAAAEESASAPTAAHDSASAPGAWQADGAMEVEEPDFGLDAGVRYWTDYLKTRLHPRTCFALPGMHAGVVEFDKFDHGREAATLRLCDDLYDDLRFFVEECDSLGGVHVMANADDGFAGLTSTYLGRMRDELGTTTPLFVVGSNAERDAGTTSAPVYKQALRRRDQRAAEARLVAECIEVSAQYVPIEAACGQRLDYVHPVPFNAYHSSAVIALALDVGYTPLRYSGAGLSSAGMTNLLRPAPFAIVSSLFTKFPVVQAPTSVHEEGYFYNRESVTKLSMRTFFEQRYVTSWRRRRVSGLKKYLRGSFLSRSFERRWNSCRSFKRCNASGRIPEIFRSPNFTGRRVTFAGVYQGRN